MIHVYRSLLWCSLLCAHHTFSQDVSRIFFNLVGEGTQPEDFTQVNDLLFFEAFESQEGGFGIYTLSNDSIDLLTDINSKNFDRQVSEAVAFGDLLLFAGDNGDDSAPWISTGDSLGTLNLAPNDGNVQPSEFTVLSDTLAVFAGNTLTDGRELWVTDGTQNGTGLLKDISISSQPQNFLAFKGKAYFQANVPQTTGAELWVTDGTEDGTMMLKDVLNAGTLGSSPKFLTDAGDFFFFVATGFGLGTELYKSDGTPEGTVLVKDINPSGSPSITSLYVWKGKAYFDADDGENGRELWVSDGTEEGTMMLKDINPNGGSFPVKFAPVNDELLFAADNGTNGSELWKTDGTEEGTVLLKDINAGLFSSINELTSFGNKAFFTANDGVTGDDVWVTDGTEAGTFGIADANDAVSPASVRDFTYFQGDIYFSAFDINSARQLYRIMDDQLVGLSTLEEYHADCDVLHQGQSLSLSCTSKMRSVIVSDLAGQGFELFPESGEVEINLNRGIQVLRVETETGVALFKEFIW